jgi:hypothetical protein
VTLVRPLKLPTENGLYHTSVVVPVSFRQFVKLGFSKLLYALRQQLLSVGKKFFHSAIAEHTRLRSSIFSTRSVSNWCLLWVGRRRKNGVNVLHWRCIAEAIQQMVVSVVVTFFITR